MVVRFRDSPGVQRGNATFTASLLNIPREIRGFFVGRCESSCANICLIDCDRIFNLTRPPEVSNNDGITENEQDIALVVYQYQKILVLFKNDLRAMTFEQLALLNECHVAKVRSFSAPLALLGVHTMLNDTAVVASTYPCVDLRRQILYIVNSEYGCTFIENLYQFCAQEFIVRDSLPKVPPCSCTPAGIRT